MGFQDLVATGCAMQVGLFLARVLPRWAGYGLARSIAGLVALSRPQVFWTVRANLSQVMGLGADSRALDDATYRVFAYVGQAYYDFFRSLGVSLNAPQDLVSVPAPLLQQIRDEMDSGRGVLLLGPHVGAFDLGMLALRAHGLRLYVLTLADPPAGFEFWNRLRAYGELEVAPITPESLRTAIRRLRDGELVVTGAERPIPGDQELVEFFGRPAPLSVGPVRMALVSDAAVYVASCYYSPQRGHVLAFTGPVEMVRRGNRQQDISANMRRVVGVLEEHIRAHPDQWFMFYSVWPQGSVH